MKYPMPYQEEGASFLARERRALLADGAGMGKTLQAIRACDHIGARRVLVLSPPSAVVNWRREFEESSLLDPEVNVFTSNTARGAFLHERYDAVILDEAHYFKAYRSQRTQLVYGHRTDGEGLVSRAPYTFLLTATPMPNHPGEVWTHLHALRPELIPGPTGPMGFFRFQQVYCQIQQTPFGPRVTGVRPTKVAALRAILSRFMLRRNEDEVTLPELRVGPLYVEAHVAKAWSEDSARVMEALDSGGVAALRGLATEAATLRRLLGLAKVEPTIAYAEDWLAANDGKLCLYGHHKEVLEAFARVFRGRCAVITGATTDRQVQIDRFQTDDSVRVFIGQIQAAGEAITLTRASEVLLVEPSWVPSQNYQVIKRIHRIGQDKPCQARFVTVAGSIDEAINRALARKEAMISAVMEAA